MPLEMESQPRSPIGEQIASKLTVRPSSSIPQNQTTGNPMPKVKLVKRTKKKKGVKRTVKPQLKLRSAPKAKPVPTSITLNVKVG